MLNGLPVTRFAFFSPPERERRLAFFTKKNATNGPGKNKDDDEQEDGYDEGDVDELHLEMRKEITELRNETREKLDAALEGIVKLPIIEHATITENPLFSLHDILHKKHGSVMTLLGDTEKTVHAPLPNWVDDESQKSDEFQEMRKTIDTVRGKVRGSVKQFEAFRGHLAHVTEEDVDTDTVEGREKLGPNADAKNFRGQYDPTKNIIYFNKKLTDLLQRDNVRKHERGHAIMYGLMRHLGEDIFGKVIREQNAALEGQRSIDDALNHEALHEHYGDIPRNEQVDVLSERYLNQRFPTGEPEIPDERERSMFEAIEKVAPELQGDRLFAAFGEEILREITPSSEKKEPLLHDVREFQKTLSELQSAGDSVGNTIYAPCKGQRRLLVLAVIERYRVWKDGKKGTKPVGGSSLVLFENTAEKELFAKLDSAFNQYLPRRVKQAVEKIDERVRYSRRFDALLRHICTKSKGNDQYILYAGNTALAMEELLNRFNDFRDGRDLDKFRDEYELCLFSLLDREGTLNLESHLSQKRRDEIFKQIDDGVGLSIQKKRKRDVAEDAEAEINAEECVNNPTTDEKRFSVDTGIDDPADDGNKTPGAPEKEKAPVDADELTEKVHGLQGDIKQLTGLVSSTVSILQKHGATDAEIAEWSGSSEHLAKGLHVTESWTRASTLVGKWQNTPRMAPGQFLSMAPMALDLRDRDYENFTVMVKDAAPNGEWLEEDHPAMKALGKLLNELLSEIEGTAKAWQKKVNGVRNSAQTIQKIDKLNKEEGGWSWKFYSIKHVMNAVTIVWESYTKAWDQWSTLRQSEIANGIGNMLKGIPFIGEQAKMTLEMALDHKNDEIKDEYKKHLEHDHATFQHCCQGHNGHPSLLVQMKNDPNKFRGVLEYMASKGWLFDFDAQTGSVFGMKIKDSLPTTWLEERKEQYVRELEQQNSTGEDAEIAKGKSLVNNYPDIPPMIKALNYELERKNYWATLGILERIVEKGKYAYSPIWASTVILNMIRDDPTARKYFPKKLQDKIGTNGLATGMIHFFFKIDRHDLERYQKNEHAEFKQAGTFATIFEAVEHEIQARQEKNGLKPMERDQLLEKISQVLAGQIVTGDNDAWTLSIYENIKPFKKYRDYRRDFLHSFDAKTLDDDYYNPDNNGTELVLLGAAAYREILSTNSAGAFDTKDKARMFIEQLLTHYETLKKAVKAGKLPAGVFTNYVKATREKLDNVYGAWTVGTGSQIVSYKGRPHNDFLIRGLFKHHLLSWPPSTKKDITVALAAQMGITVDDPLPQGFLDTPGIPVN